MPPKTIEAMMGEMTDPGTIEMNAKYQNARDAVAWAWKIAQDFAGENAPPASIAAFASALIPSIEADLNKTLEILREGSSGK